ncbi:MAG: Nif3-like dinuclear metal center hexameric protein [Phycisphaeraceae bacterium]|nr:Nif3-like dinuclear metal center hexameric protein [Phycisphaeraceae bacterium]
MKINELTAIFNQIAPLHLAESWDNVGLLVGQSTAKVSKALICIDLTESVLDEAISRNSDMILAYHPPIFSPLKTITDGDTKARIVLRAIENKIAIYSPHTAIDAAEGGVNDWLCEAFGKGSRKPIDSANTSESKQYKIITFVPQDDQDKLRIALSKAGAGQIGNYEQCSFTTQGIGTFQGNQASNPTLGDVGRLEHAPEARLEMVLPAQRLTQVIDALRQTHPYEEPAFDVIPLASPPVASTVGMGRILTLDKPLSFNACVSRLKKHLGVKILNIAKTTANECSLIRKIGLCAGAGGSLLEQAGDIDLFITGEMRHHDVLAAVDGGISVLLAGHTQTERPFLPRLRDMLIEQGARTISWQISEADAPPSVYG